MITAEAGQPPPIRTARYTGVPLEPVGFLYPSIAYRHHSGPTLQGSKQVSLKVNYYLNLFEHFYKSRKYKQFMYDKRNYTKSPMQPPTLIRFVTSPFDTGSGMILENVFNIHDQKNFYLYFIGS